MIEEDRKKLKVYCFERRLIAFQIYSEQLIEDIESAFYHSKYPGDENLVASPEHRAKCEECREYYEFFVGKAWQECLEDESYGKICGGQSFFETSAWHYYLPAYLIQLLKHQRFSAVYGFQEFLDEDLPELIEWQKEKINLLTAKQCKVIADYLKIALKVWEGIEKGYEDDLKPLTFWQGNHRKALIKEQNLQK